MPTPESLVQMSLTVSPCAHDSPPRCTEAIEGSASPIPFQNSSANASPERTSRTASSPVRSDQACSGPVLVETTEPSSSTQPTSAGMLTVSYSAQTISPFTSPVRSSTQAGSPSEVLVRPSQPISCQDEEMALDVDHNRHFIQSKSSPGHANFSPEFGVNASTAHARPGSTEAHDSAKPKPLTCPQYLQSFCFLSSPDQPRAYQL
ncbi:hypothetical protein EYF80_053663 [Liparis tanakae]|uniref:Uncharacterized protein n=1 Tax=Liparis tanakae TaxID=230148 RepID=A0A4Z2F4M6_9TELE|nr:hypothetical protein EYF80_053663 [Liparis tanakae]